MCLFDSDSWLTYFTSFKTTDKVSSIYLIYKIASDKTVQEWCKQYSIFYSACFVGQLSTS